jgi:hypothetical protein
MSYASKYIQKLADERGISIAEARIIFMNGEFKPEENDNGE